MIDRRLGESAGEIDDIIGKKVKLLRSQGWRGQVKPWQKEGYTVDDVYFRISLDGKVIVCVLLKEVKGVFTLPDLILL